MVRDIFGQELKEGDIVAVAVRGGYRRGMDVRLVRRFRSCTDVLLYNPKEGNGAWFKLRNVVKAPEGYTPDETFRDSV